MSEQLMCPECEHGMEYLLTTKNDNLYRCPNCKLEQYESAVVDYWVRYTVDEMFDEVSDLVSDMVGLSDKEVRRC